MNYDNKIFRPISNTDNGETSSETIFIYKQVGNILTSEYTGGKILKGHLIGLVNKDGEIDMRYHQGVACGEIAQRLKSTVDAVYQALRRIHVALKECVEQSDRRSSI